MKQKSIVPILYFLFFVVLSIQSFALNFPPNMTFSSDMSIAKIGTNVLITAIATDNDGVQKILLFDGKNYTETPCTGNFCQATLNATSDSISKVAYSAWAYDSLNATRLKTLSIDYVECLSGESESQTCGVSSLGACRLGSETRTCDQNNSWGNLGTCIGAIDPIIESCNSLDDNCDGTIDNGLPAVCSINGDCNDSDIHTNDSCNNPGVCQSYCEHTWTNSAPIFLPIENKATTENQSLTFTVSATDADSDSLSYSAVDLPSNARFNSSTKTFFWTPDITQSGTYTITFFVTDSYSEASQAIIITVNDLCIENWKNQDSCKQNDQMFRIYNDSNTCGTKNHLPQDNGTYIGACDYCVPLATNNSWSAWMNNSCQAGKMNQTRTRTQYDSNNCFSKTGLPSDTYINITFTQSQLIDPNLVNTSWSAWSNNGSCRITDSQLQIRSLTQYDTLGCALNQTFTQTQSLSCDYCSPILAWNNFSSWVNSGVCRINDTQLQSRSKTDYDTNNCFSQTGLTSDKWNISTQNQTQSIACDYCTPLPTNTSWSAWTNNACQSGKMNQTRSQTQYDANNCFSKTGLTTDVFTNKTFTQTQLVGPLLQNTSWSIWTNITSCMFGDYYTQEKSLTQYDVYNCAINVTFKQNQDLTCDFCTPNLANTSWTNWTDSSSCMSNDTKNQTRTTTQYDSNSCNEITNQTFTQTQTASCDYCTPNWTLNLTWEKCQAGDIQFKNYFDQNNCFSQTGLASDNNRPLSINQSCSYFSPKLNITIKLPNSQSRTSFTTWNISVSTNDTADSCTYEFGQREDFWTTEPVYHSITSSDTLDKVNSTYFSKQNVDPQGDHNYLRIFCNNTAGEIFNSSIHLEIDRTKPGKITDLKALWNLDDIQNFMTLTYTMPGDDGFNEYPAIRYMELRWSKNPITSENWESASIVSLNKTGCYYPYSGGTNVTCEVVNPPCDAVRSDYSTGIFYNANNTPVFGTCMSYKGLNGTWVKPYFYYAIKTYDSSMIPSEISNTAGNYTPLYDCGIENIIFKKLKTTSPYGSNLSKTYVSPDYGSPAVPYETLYNGDEIALNFTIRNNGDILGCIFGIQQDNILGQTIEILNLSHNETKSYAYSWRVNTETTINYKSIIQTSGKGYVDQVGNGQLKFDLFGMNVSRYLYFEQVNTPQWLGTGEQSGISFFIDNDVWTGNSNTRLGDLDHNSFRWLPVKLHYYQPDGATMTLSGANTGTNASFGIDQNGLPHEFYAYRCINPNDYCLKPYVRQNNNGQFIWKPDFFSMDPGVFYTFWMTAGVYEGEYLEMAKSGNVTAMYLG